MLLHSRRCPRGVRSQQDLATLRLRVIRYRSLGGENRFMSATPRKLTQSQSLGACQPHMRRSSVRRMPGADLGVTPPYLFENCNGVDAGGRLQDRDDLAIPNIANSALRLT